MLTDRLLYRALAGCYRERGVLGFEIELGHHWNDAGLSPTDWLKWKGDDEPADWTRQALWSWEKRLNASEGTVEEPTLFSDWQAFEHPQVGPVEIGGLHYTTFDGPVLSAETLEPLLDRCAAFTRRLGEMRPRLQMHVEVSDTAGQGRKLMLMRCTVTNTGPVSTHLTEHGKHLPSNVIRPLCARFVPSEFFRQHWEVLGDEEVETPHLPAKTGMAVLEWQLLQRNATSTEASGNEVATAHLGVVMLAGGAGGLVEAGVLMPTR